MKPDNQYLRLVPALICGMLSIALPIEAETPAMQGSEFHVSVDTVDDQYLAVVETEANGDFVVVWTSYYHDAGIDPGIMVRRYASDGSPSGGVFQANSYTTGIQSRPGLAVADDGGFVVVWAGYGGGSETGYGVFGQRFSSTGTPKAGDFQINTYTTNAQNVPAVAMDGAGNFLVIWESSNQNEVGSAVYGMFFGADGSPRCAEFQVNNATTSNRLGFLVKLDVAGNAVVAWSERDRDGDQWGVVGQRIAANCSLVGSTFIVNSYTTGTQFLGSVTVQSGGEFVVIWSDSAKDGSLAGVFGQRFASSGSPRGSEFQVNQYTTNRQNLPAAAADSSGDFVVTWQDLGGQGGDSNGVRGRHFSSSGIATTDEFQVNSYTTGSQERPAVAIGADGNFIVVWQSGNQDGDAEGVYGQRFLLSNVFADGFESGDLSFWSVALP